MGKKEKTVGIIGLGLLGGSAALRLKASGYATHVLGYDVDEEHLRIALDRQIIQEVREIHDLCHHADVIVLAIPVDQAVEVAKIVLDHSNSSLVLMDVGSTKEHLCAELANHPSRDQFVACHPIAGTEESGPAHANAELFRGKVNIICDQYDSSPTALSEIQLLIQHLGMSINFMDSHEHDRHIAFVSHMSHISSFVLGETVLEVEQDEKNIFDLAGSGFESTVRLAKSSPDMWAPIFCENAPNILNVLDAYISNLGKIRAQIAGKDAEGLRKKMQDVNKIRDVLKGQAINQKIQ